MRGEKSSRIFASQGESMVYAVDVDYEEQKYQRDQLRNPRYFGFDPSAEYVIRSKNRAYTGLNLGVYQFTNGEYISGRLRSDATEEQKWQRGARLADFEVNSHGRYKVYRRGTEPPAHLEPMWQGQADPVTDALEDTGEERYASLDPTEAEDRWQDVPQDRPVTRYPAARPTVTGEAAADPVITKAKPEPVEASSFDPETGQFSGPLADPPRNTDDLSLDLTPPEDEGDDEGDED